LTSSTISEIKMTPTANLLFLSIFNIQAADHQKLAELEMISADILIIQYSVSSCRALRSFERPIAETDVDPLVLSQRWLSGIASHGACASRGRGFRRCHFFWSPVVLLHP
jgi:hypothetical protein